MYPDASTPPPPHTTHTLFSVSGHMQAGRPREWALRVGRRETGCQQTGPVYYLTVGTARGLALYTASSFSVQVRLIMRACEPNRVYYSL